MMPSATSDGQSATNCGRADAGVRDAIRGPRGAVDRSASISSLAEIPARGVRTLGKDPLISPHPQSGRDPDSRALPILDLSGQRGRGQDLKPHLEGEMCGSRLPKLGWTTRYVV